jgi:hypothetical protein
VRMVVGEPWKGEENRGSELTIEGMRWPIGGFGQEVMPLYRALRRGGAMLQLGGH